MFRFLFCILFTFSFSYKDFSDGNKHTPVLKSAVDALNIVDLIVEMGKILKWFFLRVLLRRRITPSPDDGIYDIDGAMNKKRDMSFYTNGEHYLMSDLGHEADPTLESGHGNEDGGAAANPTTLDKRYPLGDEDVWDEELPESAISQNSVPPAYSSTFGDKPEARPYRDEEKV